MKNLFYDQHLFICNNKKKDGTGCGAFEGTEEVLKNLKAHSRQINACNEPGNKVRVSASGCLGRCQEGPIAVLYPQGQWFQLYHEQGQEKLIQLFQSVLTTSGVSSSEE